MKNSETKPRRPGRRVWTLLLVASAVLLVLPPAVYGIAYLVCSARYAGMLCDELEAAGKPCRIAHLVAEMRPEESAAALAWRWICYDVQWTRDEKEAEALNRFLATGDVGAADRPVLQRLIERNRDLLERAGRATDARSGVSGLPVPFVSLDFGRLACLRAILEQESAIESCGMISAFARAVEGEPCSVAQVVRVGLYELLLDLLRRRLPEGLSPEERAFFREALDGVEPWRIARLAFLAERAAGIAAFESVLEGRSSLKEAFGLHVHGPLGARLGAFLLYPGKPWLKRAYARYLAAQRGFIASLDLPYCEASKAIDGVLEETYRLKDFLVIALIPPTRGRLDPYAQLEARLALARFALAVSEKPPCDPLDPSRGAIRERREGGAHTVWSVGLNARDEGGAGDDIAWVLP